MGKEKEGTGKGEGRRGIEIGGVSVIGFREIDAPGSSRQLPTT